MSFITKYQCKKCNYICTTKSQWKQHCKTKKHTKILEKKTENQYICECGKRYKHQSSLSKHKKTCSKVVYISNNETNNINALTNLVQVLIKENKELQCQVVELAKEPKTITNIGTQNNFNIVHYLNTDCKDAMNLTDFIRQFQISYHDLLQLKEKGVLHTFKHTFVKHLQDMELTKRPIHCSDKKRKKFYVKDYDIWSKDEEHKKIKGAIKNMTNEQCRTLQKWKKINPDWLDNESKQEDVNEITKKICSVYDTKERNKLINELSVLTLDKSDLI